MMKSEKHTFEDNFAKLIKSDFGVLMVNVEILENSVFMTWEMWEDFKHSCVRSSVV